jgi:hypothetical protein
VKLGEALSQTGHDLLIGFAVVCVLGLVVLLITGWHYTEHYRKPRWAERAAQREPADHVDFSSEIRVTRGDRRGPEPIENHGRKRVGL